DRCHLHVFNLSTMNREDAEALVRRMQGRLCVQLHRRQDGTVITRDCPEGMRASRRRFLTAFAELVAMLAAAVGIGKLFNGTLGSAANKKMNNITAGTVGT